MKYLLLLLVSGLGLMSCDSRSKTVETARQSSHFTSDILLQSTAVKPFSRTDKNDYLYLTLTGTSLLESKATFQVIDDKGVEIYCERFDVAELIRPEYKTANTTLKAAHIREVVDGFFVDDLDFQQIKEHSLAKL